jgi:hypothetical protein
VVCVSGSHTGEFLRRYYDGSGSAPKQVVKISSKKPRGKKKKEWVQ